MKRFYKFFPIFFIFIIWFIFAHPYFLKNKIPYSATYQVNNFSPWDAYPQLRGPVKNGAMPDITTQIYPWKHFTIETWKQGEVPLWNPYSFVGTPHLANYQSAVFTPMNLLFFVFPFRDAWSLLILLQPLLAGMFMYLFLRSLALSKWGSVFSAVGFMFCGFITVWMDYGTLAYAILFLPLALFAIEKFYETKKIRYLFLLSAAIPLSFFSGHFQISIYFFIAVLMYQGYKFIAGSYFLSFPLVGNLLKLKTTSSKRSWTSQDDIGKAFFLFLYTCFGLLLSLPQILPSLEFYSQSLRSTLFQKGEVIPWAYLPTFLAPDFFGNPVTRNDWFGHYAEWNAYIGVLPLLLGVYALKKKSSYIYFLFFSALVVLFLVFPTPLVDLLIALHIPVLSTSATSRMIVLFSFLFLVLAGFGFDELLHDIKKNNKKPIHILLGIFTVIFGLLWLVIITKSFIPIDKISIAKQNLILPTGLFIIITVLILFLSFPLVGNLFKLVVASSKRFWTSLSILSSRSKDQNDNNNKRILIQVLSLLLLLITSFDMLRFATKWQPFDPKELAFIDVPVTQFFPRIAGHERVIGNFGAEAAVYYHLPSLEGYDALYINRSGQFIVSLADGKVKDGERSVVTFPHKTPYTPKAINLLNIKYIVHKVSDDKQVWTFPYWEYPEKQFEKLYDDGAYRIYENTAVLPRAFLVDAYVVKKNPQEIFDTLFAKDFDMREKIVLEKDPGMRVSKDNNGSAKIIHVSPNTMTIAVDTKKDSLLFTSDPYATGWRATVDGKTTEIVRANYMFRAIRVSSGKHTVLFTYQPFSFTLGKYIAGIGLLGMLSVGYFLWYKNKKIT